MIRCTHCGSVECHPGVDRDTDFSGLVYTKESLELHARAGRPRRERWRNRKRTRCFFPGGLPRRVCEVGPGAGALAEELYARAVEVTLVEKSPAYAEALKERFAGRARVIEGDFMEADVGGPFGAVVACQVLEHMPDPRAFLARCLALVRPGGTVCIETPSASSLELRLLGAAWYTVRVPDHLFLVSPAGARRLVEVIGGRMLAVDTSEPWWELPTALISVLTSALRRGHSGSAQGCDSLAKRLAIEATDASRPFTLPARLLLERFGMGSQVYFTFTHGSAAPGVGS